MSQTSASALRPKRRLPFAQAGFENRAMAVLGIVSGTDTNSQYPRNEDFAKSRMSQDITLLKSQFFVLLM